jgi:hypothetical protein
LQQGSAHRHHKTPQGLAATVVCWPCTCHQQHGTILRPSNSLIRSCGAAVHMLAAKLGTCIMHPTLHDNCPQLAHLHHRTHTQIVVCPHRAKGQLLRTPLLPATPAVTGNVENALPALRVVLCSDEQQHRAWWPSPCGPRVSLKVQQQNAYVLASLPAHTSFPH